jgi:tetratricopeptide (TPR) repeat protein
MGGRQELHLGPAPGRPGGQQRPAVADRRPGISQLPNRPTIGERPDVRPRPPGTGVRPEPPIIRTDRPNRPDRPIDRPNWADRPHAPDHPGINNFGNHNTVINRPITNNTNISNVSNRGVAAHVNDWGNRWNQNFNYAHAPYRGWYHGAWSGDWYNHWGVGPVAWGLGTWGLTSLAYQSGASSFANPYYAEAPVVQDVPAVDYSQPIQVVSQAPPADSEAPPSPDEQGMKAFDRAREAFMSGDYAVAEREVNKALVRLPNEPVIHEFRALVLFAEKKYRDCAAALEALLAVSPGWDWTTLSSLYLDTTVYEGQLRALEQAAREDPKAAYLQFDLAYHYLTLGYADNAKKALQKVVSLEPNDRVAAQLLQTLVGPEDTAKAPAPAAEAPPADVQLDIKGIWKAAGAGGSEISLSIADGGQFKWAVNNKGKTESFRGTFTLDGDMMMLERSGGGALVGHVHALSKDSFSFQLVGAPAGDPGLTFKK